ncbi:PIN domain-containing protein [Ferruginibacter sp.]
MTILVDSNIIISACLESKSELFKIITAPYSHLDFATPHFALKEIIKNQDEICRKMKKSLELFQNNLSVLLDCLFVLPDEDLSNKNIIEAEDFTASIDIDDTIFIAFSMALDLLLWTGDLKLRNALKRKGFKNVIITKELKQIIKGL